MVGQPTNEGTVPATSAPSRCVHSRDGLPCVGEVGSAMTAEARRAIVRRWTTRGRKAGPLVGGGAARETSETHFVRPLDVAVAVRPRAIL